MIIWPDMKAIKPGERFVTGALMGSLDKEAIEWEVIATNKAHTVTAHARWLGVKLGTFKITKAGKVTALPMGGA